jgi:hypothetical protein
VLFGKKNHFVVTGIMPLEIISDDFHRGFLVRRTNVIKPGGKYIGVDRRRFETGIPDVIAGIKGKKQAVTLVPEPFPNLVEP